SDDGVWIAMELIEGGTLTEWQRPPDRSWREIVRAYVEAGRGLAAAHAAGLVHRDFKPDNVLISDGHAKVTDFGLVRATGAEPAPEAEPIAREASELTEAGSLMGTVLYMSPEQLGARGADERSDQFSLCVAAWEALYRERPFRGDDTDTLRREIAAGPPKPPA